MMNLTGGKKLFSFNRGKRSAGIKPAERSVRVPKLKDPAEEPPFYVRGQRAGSRDEYWTGLAMEKIEKQTGWGWDFQVPLNGGRRRRGGNVADFLVYTPGRWTILDPMGRIWHTGSREDRYQMENVARERNWNLIAWFTDETPTRELTYQLLRREFHL